MTTNTVTVAGSTSPLTSTGIASGTVVASTLINAWGAMTVPAYNRAINFIADNLASFPRSVARKGAKIGEDDAPHPLTRLLTRRPNGYTNDFNFWRAMFYNVAHRGNAIARIDRDPQTLAPVALHVVPFDDVAIALFRRDVASPIEKWYGIRSTGEVMPAADVIHLQSISHDGQQGVDTVALLESTLQQAATLARYQTRFLQSGTMLKAAITFDGDMTDDQLETMAASIVRHFTGPTADRDVMLIPKGGKFQNATLTPQQSQIVEQVTAATKAISQVTGVPPEFLFERGESKYTGVEQAGQNVERYLFRPWAIQIEAELTGKLLSEADQDAGWSVRLNTDALLRGDTQTQTSTVMASVAGGVRTPNEARGLLGMPKLDDPEADRLKRTGDTSPEAGLANGSAVEKTT